MIIGVAVVCGLGGIAVGASSKSSSSTTAYSATVTTQQPFAVPPAATTIPAVAPTTEVPLTTTAKTTTALATCSKGDTSLRTVPDIVGWNASDAMDALCQAGFDHRMPVGEGGKMVIMESHWTVIGMNLTPGSTVSYDTEVDLLCRKNK
ncbi:PASTA domain-containing protein [Nocardia heshunensis]